MFLRTARVGVLSIFVLATAAPAFAQQVPVVSPERD